MKMPRTSEEVLRNLMPTVFLILKMTVMDLFGLLLKRRTPNSFPVKASVSAPETWTRKSRSVTKRTSVIVLHYRDALTRTINQRA